MVLLSHMYAVVDGRKLTRRLTGFDAGRRALLALDLERGAVCLFNLTRSQAALIARVSRAR